MTFRERFYLATWWLTREGVRFLFTNLPDGRWFGEESKAERIICRFRGHPAGVVWFNVNGMEPDMTCRSCGEDLG